MCVAGCWRAVFRPPAKKTVTQQVSSASNSSHLYSMLTVYDQCVYAGFVYGGGGTLLSYPFHVVSIHIA